MKKLLMAILSVTLMLTIVTACGNNEDTSTSTPETNTNAQDSTNTGSENTGSANTGSENTSNDSSADSSGSNDTSNFDADRIIAVFTREEGSGTRDAFVSTTGVGDDMYIEAVVVSETNELLTKVEESEHAIGYVSVGSLSDRVKALSISGVIPSDETIKDGTYTIQRPLLVCVNEQNAQNDIVNDFIDFMLSAQGQAVSSTRWTAIDDNAPQYSPSGLSGTIRVGGSTSVDPLMQGLRQAYIALNPNVQIEISGGGSGTGISEATSGVIEMGMSSRALRDNEKEALADITIALDGVAIIVNPANPMTDITTEQVREIFTGEITRWTDLVG